MDTKLKNNGERPELPALPVQGQDAFLLGAETEHPPKKGGANSALLYLLGVMLCILTLFGVSQIRLYDNTAYESAGVSKMKRMLNANSVTARNAAEEVLRYEKNLQRFFIHYDGFNPENPQEITAASTEEIRQLQIEHELMYQQAVREIMEKYSEQIDTLEAKLKERMGLDYKGITENTYSSRYIEDQKNEEAAITDRTEPMQLDGQSVELYNSYLQALAEREQAIQEAERIYILSDAAAAELIEQNRQESSVYDASNYYDIKAYLENTAYLRYCLKKAHTNEYLTNIPVEEWVSESNPVRYAETAGEYTISVQDDYFSTIFNSQPLNESFKSSGISGYILIPAAYGEDNPIAIYMNEKTYTDDFFEGFRIAVIILSALTVLVAFAFFQADKKRFLRMIYKTRRIYNKMPLTLKLVILGVIIYWILQSIGISNIANAAYHTGMISAVTPYIIRAALGAAASVFIILAALHLKAFVYKPSIFFDEPEFGWLRQFFEDIALVYSQRITALSVSMTLLLLLFCAGQGVVWVFGQQVITAAPIAISQPVAFGILEALLCVLTLYVLGLITALAKTNKYMDEIISGNFEQEIVDQSVYRIIINKLNRLRGGVRRVVVEKNKSEKMKADLITNVSHDLKTPLTSIINYIELLKTAGLTEEQRMSYIDILDQKSQRVRFLIEDLFEASKLSSGQITLDKAPLNITEMLQQAAGELEDRFQGAGVALKLSGNNENILVMADGKKLWRVFENLLTNMIKYSQAGTRAYVDIATEGTNAVLTFKNVSSYEMNFEYEELFERFKRGDVARTTEGSGLGLSIAKDIVELHGGTMEINIDGDLFKVIIVIGRTV